MYVWATILTLGLVTYVIARVLLLLCLAPAPGCMYVCKHQLLSLHLTSLLIFHIYPSRRHPYSDHTEFRPASKRDLAATVPNPAETDLEFDTLSKQAISQNHQRKGFGVWPPDRPCCRECRTPHS